MSTTALSASGLKNAIQQMRQFVTDKDDAQDCVSGSRLYLHVHPANEFTAKQITQSAIGSAAMERNILSSGYDIVVLVNPFFGDPTDWFLSTAPAATGFSGPLHFWTRLAPTYAVSEDQDSKQIKISVTYASGTAAGPDPTGIIGSQVAG
jgi:hypothetical protein